jgi:phosphopantetheinyl transferase
MPIFFQHQINENTRLGIWKIEETEEFFKGNVPQHRDVTHPHKRLQHLAGRFLLQFLFPDFPYALIQIADTRKPFLPGEEYHFSISHCGDYAAAIVSRDSRVGIDIEVPAEKIIRIQDKFLSVVEKNIFLASHEPADYSVPTILWSSKEAVFKWYGNGEVDFKKHILLEKNHKSPEIINCTFSKTDQQLVIHFRQFNHLVLSWIIN